MDSGSTLAASMLAPNSPRPNSSLAFGPASGSSARAASSADWTWMPATKRVAAVQTTMKAATTPLNTDPSTTSVRSAG